MEYCDGGSALDMLIQLKKPFTGNPTLLSSLIDEPQYYLSNNNNNTSILSTKKKRKLLACVPKF